MVTRSSSWCTLLSGFSSTTIAKMLVPTLTLPVRGATAFVATMPVPASPSGGHSGMPGRQRAGGVEQRGALLGQPAGVLAGEQDLGQQRAPSVGARGTAGEHPLRRRRSSPVSIGNMPEASPMPSTLRPVSFQCT